MNREQAKIMSKLTPEQVQVIYQDFNPECFDVMCRWANGEDIIGYKGSTTINFWNHLRHYQFKSREDAEALKILSESTSLGGPAMNIKQLQALRDYIQAEIAADRELHEVDSAGYSGCYNYEQKNAKLCFKSLAIELGIKGEEL